MICLSFPQAASVHYPVNGRFGYEVNALDTCECSAQGSGGAIDLYDGYLVVKHDRFPASPIFGATAQRRIPIEWIAGLDLQAASVFGSGSFRLVVMFEDSVGRIEIEEVTVPFTRVRQGEFEKLKRKIEDYIFA